MEPLLKEGSGVFHVGHTARCHVVGCVHREEESQIEIRQRILREIGMMGRRRIVRVNRQRPGASPSPRRTVARVITVSVKRQRSPTNIFSPTGGCAEEPYKKSRYAPKYTEEVLTSAAGLSHLLPEAGGSNEGEQVVIPQDEESSSASLSEHDDELPFYGGEAEPSNMRGDDNDDGQPTAITYQDE